MRTGLIGGVEGQGLIQAQARVRLHAPDGCGLRTRRRLGRARSRDSVFHQAHPGRGAALGEAGLHAQTDRAERCAARSGRAYIEETAERIDAGEGSLNTEGAIAKYMSTEAGNLAADASIQALGGYGYTHEYMVEKIKRDVRITTIYEGTSEIMEMTISRDRWQLHLKTRGPALSRAGARNWKRCTHGIRRRGREHRRARSARPGRSMERARVGTPHALPAHSSALGELIAYAECAGSLARRAALMAEGRLNEKANQRFDAVGAGGDEPHLRPRSGAQGRRGRPALGCRSRRRQRLGDAGFEDELGLPAIHRAQAGLIADMDYVADVLYGRAVEKVGVTA